MPKSKKNENIHMTNSDGQIDGQTEIALSSTATWKKWILISELELWD